MPCSSTPARIRPRTYSGERCSTMVALDVGLVKQLAEQEARGTCANDCDLRAHEFRPLKRDMQTRPSTSLRKTRCR